MVQTGNQIVADDFDFDTERLECFNNAFDMTRSAAGLRSWSRRRAKINNSRVRCDVVLLQALPFDRKASCSSRCNSRRDCATSFAPVNVSRLSRAGAPSKKIRSRSTQQPTMRIDHEHFARARECSKDHEKILTALPRESLSRDREHIRAQRAQRFETFEMTAGLELGARDQSRSNSRDKAGPVCRASETSRR